MVVMSGEGCVGRCDARCHNAKTEECDCCCAGAFHGRGLTTALAGAAARGAELCADYIERKQLAGATAIVLHDEAGKCLECKRPTRDWKPMVGVKYAMEEAISRGKKIDPETGHKMNCKLRITPQTGAGTGIAA